MRNALNQEKLYDLVAAVPLILWLGLGAAGSLLKFFETLKANGDTFKLCTQITEIFFLLLAIALLLVRHPPIRKAKGLWPRFAGILGCVMPFFVMVLPHAALSYPMTAFLSAIGFVGAVASVYVMFWLGRSFSILPQARGLVTDGPYRFVRHPLYFAEFLVIFSRVFELAQPWPFLMIAVAVGSQMARIRYEERILSETFPAYRNYARHTKRLIPGLY
jgi:protein-S-isoprenylcysteine O-methyltransferase Ste14